MFTLKLTPTRLPMLLLSAVLAACSNVPDAGPSGMDFSVSLAGTKPSMQREFETVDLLGLLDPSNALNLKEKDTQGADKFTLGERYDKALNGFASTGSSGQQLRLHRNLVQNRIVAASDLRCGRFIQHLRTQGSDTNFGLGVATTLFAAAAAVVPGVSDAKTLAALSAFTSGSRAEYNTEYFSNLSISLIVRSIQDSRTGLREQIVQKQHQLNYDSYDVAAAVAEAVRYDAACNIINGLEHANEAVQRLQEPGRDAVGRALLKDKLNQAIDSGDLTQIDKYKAMVTKVQGINTTVANSILRNAPRYAAEPLNVDTAQARSPVYHLLDVETQTLAALQVAQNFMASRVTLVEVSTATPDPQQARDKLNTSFGVTFKAETFTARFKRCRAKATQLEGERIEASYALENSLVQSSEKTDRAANIEKQYALQKAELAVAQFNNFLDDFPQQVQTHHTQWLKDFTDAALSKIKLTEFKTLWESNAKKFQESFPKVDTQCPQPK